jgi:hypothetical protein
MTEGRSVQRLLERERERERERETFIDNQEVCLGRVTKALLTCNMYIGRMSY